MPVRWVSESAKPAAKNTQAAKQSPRPRLRQRGVPGWLVPTALALCVVGLLVSAYLTYDTFSGGGNLAVPDGDWPGGLARARASIDSGAAVRALDRMIEVSNQ